MARLVFFLEIIGESLFCKLVDVSCDVVTANDIPEDVLNLVDKMKIFVSTASGIMVEFLDIGWLDARTFGTWSAPNYSVVWPSFAHQPFNANET